MEHVDKSGTQISDAPEENFTGAEVYSDSPHDGSTVLVFLESGSWYPR